MTKILRVEGPALRRIRDEVVGHLGSCRCSHLAVDTSRAWACSVDWRHPPLKIDRASADVI